MRRLVPLIAHSSLPGLPFCCAPFKKLLMTSQIGDHEKYRKRHNDVKEVKESQFKGRSLRLIFRVIQEEQLQQIKNTVKR